MQRFLLFLALLPALGALAQTPVQLDLVPWAEDLGPITDIAYAGDGRLFVASQNGMIHVVTDSMTVLPTPFLDLTASVSFGLEMGLLGLVFDPDHADNGLFYVHYTPTGANPRNRVARFSVSADPNVADAGSEQLIYSGPPVGASFHRGGDLDFGPDGRLYIAFGDGFSPENAQDLSDPLGDIVRIDVSDLDTTYTLPLDNPYMDAGPDTLPEIWASGLRNPFRFGFDRLTGDLWIGDVGYTAWEEIDLHPALDNSGPNFGWPCYEGNAGTGCPAWPNYAAPVITQAHGGLGGTFCAIIGGRVYRGAAWPHLYGRYVYTDFCAGEFRTLRANGTGGWTDELAHDAAQSGFTCIGENAAGELFAGNKTSGVLYKLIDRCPMDAPAITASGNGLESSLAVAYQWFFNGDAVPGATAQQYQPDANGDVHVIADLGNGCLLSSDTVAFIVTGVIAIDRPTVRLSPVPATDELVVRMQGATVQWLRVLDASGRVVRSLPCSSVEERVDTKGFATGQYTLQAIGSGGSVVATQRFSVQH